MSFTSDEIRAKMLQAAENDVAPSPPLWPPWKNPWIMAFVIGIALLTALAPRLRYVPEPPAHLGDAGIARAEIAGAVAGSESKLLSELAAEGTTVVYFAYVGSDKTCASPDNGVLKQYFALRQTGEPLKFATLVLGSAPDDTKWAARAVQARGGEVAGWPTLRLSADSASVFDAAFASSASLPRCVDFPAAGYFALLDTAGGIRGFYDAARPDVVSELWHRAERLRKDGARSR